MNYADELKKTLLLRDLPAAEIAKLAAIAEEHNIGAGTELFREGQELKRFYVIVMGSVRVLKKDKSGNNEEITTLASGSYVGEVELVRPVREAAATIETIEPTTVIALPYNGLESLFAKDDGLARQFYHALARGLARRLAHTDEAAANYRMMATKRS